MRSIERSTQFKKDYKKASKSIHSSELDSRLTEVIGCLVQDYQPPPRYRDHQLTLLVIGHAKAKPTSLLYADGDTTSSGLTEKVTAIAIFSLIWS
jgi:hypothetical protein